MTSIFRPATSCPLLQHDYDDDDNNSQVTLQVFDDDLQPSIIPYFSYSFLGCCLLDENSTYLSRQRVMELSKLLSHISKNNPREGMVRLSPFVGYQLVSDINDCKEEIYIIRVHKTTERKNNNTYTVMTLSLFSYLCYCC